jgi:pyruvate ferredoxin oxidoreductase delta subunit
LKWDIKDIKEWKYGKHPSGAAVPSAGNAASYKTGGWRSLKPVKNEKCTNCLICFIYCPDSSVLVNKEGKISIDYDHCKGCGICAYECPKEALDMVDESES